MRAGDAACPRCVPGVSPMWVDPHGRHTGHTAYAGHIIQPAPAASALGCLPQWTKGGLMVSNRNISPRSETVAKHQRGEALQR